MDVLLNEIRRKYETAASELEKADFRTDSDLQLLTLQDLGELFPGVKNVKLRRNIFDIIHNQKPIDVLMKEFRDFIPHESLRAALTEHGVLVNYLKMLKEMKTQMNEVQVFLDAHIRLLEDFRKSQPLQDQDKGFNPESINMSGQNESPVMHHNSQTSDPPEIQQGTSTSSAMLSSHSTLFKRDHPEKRRATLTYKMVISGRTFNADQQILEKVKALSEDPDLILLNQEGSDQDCQVIIVFCPIVSRMATDIHAAMATVTGSQPVILVLMHHTHEPKYVTSVNTWNNYSHVMLKSHVFYHETVHGLLQCPQNNSAISEIRNALLEHADIQTIKDTRGKAQNVAAESSSTTRGLDTKVYTLNSLLGKFRPGK